MAKIFVTYSNDLYSNTRDFAAKMALFRGGFDRTIVYKPEDIDKEFRSKNVKILSQKRGAGLWLWKPYSVYKALCEEADFGDILFYGDAGSFFVRNCEYLVQSMKDEDIWVSNIPLMEKQFTKSKAFDIMDCNNDEVKDSAQIQANFICLRKSESSLQFVKEWLELCCNYDLLASDEDIQKEVPEFINHRNDQSVLSLLVKKHNIGPHLDPTQYGKYQMKYFIKGRFFVETKNLDTYKSCIFLHREKNISLKILISSILMTYLPEIIVKKLSKNYKLAINIEDK